MTNITLDRFNKGVGVGTGIFFSLSKLSYYQFACKEIIAAESLFKEIIIIKLIFVKIIT